MSKKIAPQACRCLLGQCRAPFDLERSGTAAGDASSEA
jgi:hypothetical protein